MRFTASHPTIFPRTVCILAVILCLGSFEACRAADQLPGYVVVPITLEEDANQAIMRVTINGRSTNLILDTGASATTLSDHFYKGTQTLAGGDASSKLPPELQHRNAVLNGEKVKIGYVDSLKAGAADFGGGPVYVADLAGLFTRHNSRHADTIAGLLGEDILRKYSAIIDWQRRGVYFNTDPAKRLKLGPGLTAAGWTAVPMTSTSHHHFTVACTVEDQAVRLIVDTGAGFTIFDRSAVHFRNMMYNRDNGNHLGHLAINQIQMNGLGFSSTAYLARLENWKIGSYLIPHSVVLSQATPTGLLTRGSGADAPVVGLLGAEVLASNNAIVDVAGSTLYLKPFTASKLPTRRRG